MLWYSVMDVHAYHVINANALFAGQLQRLSSILPKAEATVFANFADLAIAYVLSSQLDEKSFTNWMYYGDKIPDNKSINRVHDLLHEAYTIDGLIKYKIYGGRYSSQIKEHKLLESLNKFIHDKNECCQELPINYSETQWSSAKYPKKRTRLIRPARLWSIGHALYVAGLILDCFDGQFSIKSKLFNIATSNYWTGKIWRVTPDNSRTDKFFVRHGSTILLSLSNLITADCR